MNFSQNELGRQSGQSRRTQYLKVGSQRHTLAGFFALAATHSLLEQLTISQRHELAARGHKLVKRIQNPKATKDLVAQADLFGFAMPVYREGERLVIRAHIPEPRADR